MNIEIITLNEQDTIQAGELGASRVELVSAIQEGGLTPSYGTLSRVLNHATIPVHIMVRPHSFSYVYSDQDWAVIKEDLSIIKKLGGRHIVFGCLTEQGQVDEQLLSNVIEHVPDMDITFHRAFDEAVSLTNAYDVLQKYTPYVSRILTSGGQAKASQATDTLNQLVNKANETGGPAIMPGSGVSPANIAWLNEQIGAEDYHIGSGVRVDGRMDLPLDEQLMESVKQSLGKY